MRLEALASLYDSLSREQELAAELRRQYAEQATATRTEAKELTDEIEQLRKDKEQVDFRTQQILTPAWGQQNVMKQQLPLRPRRDTLQDTLQSDR